MSGAEVAIVIPAFKPRFLNDTLLSIARQTDRGFRVYVGDDASPHDLSAIARRFEGEFDLSYQRFDERFGPDRLTRHWQRCVEPTSEPYVWLFSDDDRMDPGCVRQLRRALAETDRSFDVYRFNCSLIDSEGGTSGYHTLFPPVASSTQFLFARLARREFGFMPLYVFSRRAYSREGGFVHLPLAWCADDASCVAFARATGMRTVDGAAVYWRLSEENLSSTQASTSRVKLEANVRFLEWIDAGVRSGGIALGETEIPALRATAWDWFRGQLPVLGTGPLGPLESARIARRIARSLGPGFVSVFRDVLSHGRRTPGEAAVPGSREGSA